MYRFLRRPKWIAFSLVCLAAMIGMINLGFWQLRRLHERREFNALVESRATLDPVPFADLASTPVAEADWRPVILEGTYTGETEEVPTVGGYLLVSALRSTDGATVRVDRGMVGAATAIPPPPDGEVQLVGRIRIPPEAVRSILPGERYVDVVESQPAEPGVSPRELPELDEGPHLSYAVQWFTFTNCVAIGWVLAVRHSARAALAARTGAAPKRRSKHQAVPWSEATRHPGRE